MLNLRYRAMLAAVAVLTILACGAKAADDKAAAAKEKETKLIAVLKSDAQPGDKAAACKQLALCGSKDAVSALAPLMADQQLAAWARIALEAMPDPAADEAFRAALDKLQGRLLIGAINSTGVRRDTKAVDGLTAKLKDADAEVASAAAVALGHIGDYPAAKALEAALPGSPAGVRSAVAEGCILCAEKLLAAGKADEAARLYDLVRDAEVPKQRRIEAIRGAILARKAAGIPLLIEQLQSADKDYFHIGLTVARELPGAEATDALIAELDRAIPARQPLLILALADRGDAKALPAVLKAAKNGPEASKLVAIRLLKKLGDASFAPMLMEAATDDNEAMAKAAAETLARLPGKEVNAEIVARLPKAEGKLRMALIQLVGERVVTGAVPAVLKAADDPNLEVRVQALAALGYAVELKDISILINRVAAQPEKAEEAKAAEVALRVACQRMPDADACAAKLIAAMSGAKVPAKIKYLEVLTAMGGKKALETVAAAATDANPEIQDAGSRLLGEWMTLDAAPVLLKLAKTSTDAKYETRAVRAYIRLVRQFSMPNEQRVGMSRTAMLIAKRDAEKKLVLDLLERYPSIDALKIAVETVKTESMKNDAAKTARVVARKLGNSAEAQELMEKAGLEMEKIEIVKAEYGAGGKVKDVTEIVRKAAAGTLTVTLPSPDYNGAFGGDPASGTVKRLTIEYRVNGKAGKASFEENASIVLPTP